MTSLYHNPFLYHDPTIINVHTLLKPQGYQQPTYNNTSPSQPKQFISPPSIPSINKPLFPSNFTHLNTHSTTEHYRSSQFHQPATYHLSNTNHPTSWVSRTPLNHHTPHQPIHNTNTISSPSFFGSQHLIHTSTALCHHHYPYLYHDPYFSPKSSPIINDFTPLHLNPTQQYAKETIKSHELIIDAQRSVSVADSAVAEQPSDTVSTSSSYHPPTPRDNLSILFDGEEDSYWWVLCIEKFFKEQGTPNALKLPTAVLALKGRAHQWWLWQSRRQPPTTREAFTTVFLWRFKPEWREILLVDNEEEETDLDLSLFKSSSIHVTEPTHFEVVSESIFTVSETDEKFETCDEVTEDKFTPTVVSQAVEEENKFAPDLIANFNPVSDSVKQQKRRVFDVTTPLPQHLFIFDSDDDKRRVRSLAIFGNGICVFDPGGNERNCGSPALNSINNHGIQSPLQAPWDRGKLGVSKSLSSIKHVFLNCLFSFTPAVVSFPARGATSGWPWVPWSSSLYDDHRLMSSPWKSCDNAILLSLEIGCV
ncbi:unnamed protein product [Trifolium pratense]|uniref:Uncharacterized protein n=1 Tax=Trifolium pratense TaxID=57577 RepID=A0ACB0JGD0_TRIPR|nr:unnamed protein product [Trifolium pratense]